MDDRFNTIAGWVLFAGIVALGSSIVAGEIFHSERPETMGYPIEGVEEEGEGGDEAEQPIAFFLASADPAQGEQVFKKCAACHTIDKGGPNTLGPNLWNSLGAPIGQGRGFAFSDALASKGGTWNWDNMSEWLKSPRSFAPGTKMTFAGLGNPEDRAAMLLYMNQQSDSPQPLPAPPAAPPGSPTVGGDAGVPAASAPGDIPGQKAQKEPVLDSPEEDPKGGGPAAEPKR
ncbi:MAG: c-type cytochrome [Sphingomicrobium sp.]